MKLKLISNIQIHEAREADNLRICPECGGLGDVRFMPDIEGTPVHGYCALKQLGVKGLAKLSERDVNRLTLEELGAQVMEELRRRMEDINQT